MSTESDKEIDPVLSAFRQGELLVYATEAVMGIGCDPENESSVHRLCELKKRPVNKGVILIAATYSQLLKYVDDKAIPMDRRTEIFSSWPGPVTWLLPKSQQAPAWITGEHPSIAVRVSAHQGVIDLCQRLDSPLVSTSANLAGEEACRSTAEAKQVFADEVIYIDGETGGNAAPSVIKDGVTGKVLRGG